MIADKKPIIIKDIHSKPNGEGSICYITLETFKENIERDLSKSKVEPLTVIEFYRKTYIENALLINRIKTIYINRRHNKPNFVLPILLSISEEFDLNNEKKAVDVLIEFEDYLNDIEKTFIINQPELTLRQVALLYIYNGDHITPENNDAIAKKYLHKTGHKLQQHYNDYYKSNSRKSFSKRKDSLLVKDIEKVIQYLPIEKQEKPTKEAELLRNMIQNNDYPSL